MSVRQTAYKKMNYYAVRWISSGTLLLAVCLFSSCAGTSKASSAPSVTLAANPASVNSGQSVTLTWQATNATSVTITASAGSSTRTLTTSSEASGSVKDAPTQTTTYTAVATGPGGSSPPQSTKVQVAATVPQITSFTATPTSISTGQTVTLSWKDANATSLTITTDSGRTVATSSQASGSVTDTPTQNTTYSAVATGAAGSSSPSTVKVQVGPAGPPQITQFTANPTSVSTGQTTTLTWVTTNATSVTFNPPLPLGDDQGPPPPSGSAVVPISQTTTFSLVATGPGGNSTPATVTVSVPLTLNFSASPSNITPGENATLSWQIAGGPPTSFTVADSSGKAVCNPCATPQGTATVTPSVTTTYTATAAASNGSNITQSATVTVSSGNASVIKHVFFMLQENRAFDMYFGQLGAYRPGRLAQFGITDTQTIDSFSPTVTLTNHNDNNAQVQPFHEKTVCTENLTPAWDESHHDTALVGGDPAWNTTTTFTNSSFSMSNFLDTTSSVTNQYDPTGSRVLGYYNEQDLPYYYDLATFFPTSDAWHSPILANTVPNRMYLMAATSFGHEYPDNSGHPLYAAPTIFRAMNTANVSWLYYYRDGVFLANFQDFSDPNIGPKVFPYTDLFNRLTGSCSGIPNSCDPDKALPQVVFIDSASGSSGLDEHPDNNIQSGAAYVQSIVQALMQSDAWADSVFILSYDEGGGLYDHVPPFMVPLPDSYAPGQCPDPNNGSPGYCAVGKLGGTFDLTGFRVPVIVISPYAKPDFVSHVPRDYTAILAFIEETFGVKPLTARDVSWQNPSCGSQVGCTDMNEFFDFTTPALLNAPNGKPWAQVLNPQTSTGVCDQKQESGP